MILKTNERPDRRALVDDAFHHIVHPEDLAHRGRRSHDVPNRVQRGRLLVVVLKGRRKEFVLVSRQFLQSGRIEFFRSLWRQRHVSQTGLHQHSDAHSLHVENLVARIVRSPKRIQGMKN